MFVFVLMMYVFLGAFCLGLSNMLLMLVFMECLSWFFCFILYKVLVIKYLMVQSVFFFMSLLGVLWSNQLLLMAIIIKMGLPPFHLWFLNLSLFMNKYTFFFFTTIHKMIPLFFLIKTLSLNFSLAMFILVSSTFMMLEMGSLFFIIILSSITHSGWMFLMSMMSMSLLIMYWVLYSMMMLLVFSSFFSTSLLTSDENQNTLLSMMWLIICGLPPFTMFWLKVNIFIFMLLKSVFFSVTVIITSVLSLVIYYRIFHLSILTSKSLMNTSVFLPIMVSIGWF